MLASRGFCARVDILGISAVLRKNLVSGLFGHLLTPQQSFIFQDLQSPSSSVSVNSNSQRIGYVLINS
jgi:hypothetical protein